MAGRLQGSMNSFQIWREVIVLLDWLDDVVDVREQFSVDRELTLKLQK